jgi:hypothetical protein
MRGIFRRQRKEEVRNMPKGDGLGPPGGGGRGQGGGSQRPGRGRMGGVAARWILCVPQMRTPNAPRKGKSL